MRVAAPWMLLTAVVLAGGAWTPSAEPLAQAPASAVDPALPEQKFTTWLDEYVVHRLPKDAARGIRFEPCEADPEGCRMLVFDIVSRARRLVLTFDRDTHKFLGGTLGGPELERMPPITSLAELPGRLTEGIRPYPLECPAATALHLREEHAGLFEWCEDGTGVNQGPARAWFNTGRYLMYRGAYVAGERTGRWTECDRFERCRVQTYE